MTSAQPSERDVIVVIGSVSAAEYERIRLDLIVFGSKPLIKRVMWEQIDSEVVTGRIRDIYDETEGTEREGTLVFDDVEEQVVTDIARELMDCAPNAVVEAVARPDDWEKRGEGSIFSPRYGRRVFPNLSTVSVIQKSPSGQIWYDPR